MCSLAICWCVAEENSRALPDYTTDPSVSPNRSGETRMTMPDCHSLHDSTLMHITTRTKLRIPVKTQSHNQSWQHFFNRRTHLFILCNCSSVKLFDFHSWVLRRRGLSFMKSWSVHRDKHCKLLDNDQELIIQTHTFTLRPSFVLPHNNFTSLATLLDSLAMFFAITGISKTIARKFGIIATERKTQIVSPKIHTVQNYVTNFFKQSVFVTCYVFWVLIHFQYFHTYFIIFQ